MRISQFHEIIAWQKAHALTLFIYKISKRFPKDEKYGLTDQIRRASTSVSANIAEGFSRKCLKDSLHFYNISESSLEEVKYFLLLSRDLHYITEEEHQSLQVIADEVGKVLKGWMKSQK